MTHITRLLLGAAALLAALACAPRAAAADTLFPYPVVPDSITDFGARCDYMVSHFWDFADPKAVLSHRQALAGELDTFYNLAVNANADVAVDAVTALARKFDKQPDGLLFLARQSERLLYGDSATTWVDELYIPMLRAAVGHKKIGKADKARFQHQLNVLSNSLPGVRAPSLPLTLRDGTAANLDDYDSQATLVVFSDPTCDDCALAKMRLDADITTNALIDKGVVRVVSVSMVPADGKWREAAASYPANWVVAATDDADLTFDLRPSPPVYYILDRDHKIRFKHLTTDQVLDVMRQLSQH